jgi:hypothetical protein
MSSHGPMPVNINILNVSTYSHRLSRELIEITGIP